MTVKQAIDELSKLNPDAEIETFNPVFAETATLVGFEPHDENEQPVVEPIFE